VIVAVVAALLTLREPARPGLAAEPAIEVESIAEAEAA
jgi:hypothetical protein